MRTTFLYSHVPLFLLCSSLCRANPAAVQQRHESPVFKDYKDASPTKGIQQSDATYQLWEGFMVARRANAGDALAQHELGLRYLQGKGFAPDTGKAARWVRKAAEQNVLPARFNLGIFLFNGWGVEWNPFEAYTNFAYCAARKMPNAQYLMAQFLTQNLIVPRNLDSAYQWAKLAASSGYGPAKELLPRLEKHIRQHPVLGDSSGRTAMPQPADSAHAGSSDPGFQTPGIVFLTFDQDTAKDVTDQTLLREALAGGDPEARDALSSGTVLDDTVTVDSVRVISLMRTADAGSPEALTVLGRCFEKGTWVRRDVVKAAAYYVRGLRLDSPRARQLLWSLVQRKGFAEELKNRAGRSDPDAQYAWAGLYSLGMDQFLAGDTRLTDEAALRLLRSGAEEDHAPSLVELGNCYYAGRWVRRDERTADLVWGRAARLGSLEAHVRMVVARVRSSPDSADRAGAIALLREAEQDGSILALVALAYCFETGTGVPSTKGEAARLYERAAVRGSQEAYYALKRMFDEIRPSAPEFQIRE